MKEIEIPMADPMPEGCKQPEPVIIKISRQLDDVKEDYGITPTTPIKPVADMFDDQAGRLANALLDSLPQGMLEPLMIKLMQRRISVYHGVTPR